MAGYSISLCISAGDIYHSNYICKVETSFGYFVIISFGNVLPKIPETPIWLLAKNRPADALKALQWLRGWVTPAAVQAEFDELQRSKINAQTCYNCEKQHLICHHPLPTIVDKIRDLFRRRTLRPFILIASLYVISVFAGITPFRPYIVQILYYYETPVDANDAVAYLGYFGFGANVLLVCTISSFGKRSLYLYSMAIVVLALFVLGMQNRLDLTTSNALLIGFISKVSMALYTFHWIKYHLR